MFRISIDHPGNINFSDSREMVVYYRKVETYIERVREGKLGKLSLLV